MAEFVPEPIGRWEFNGNAEDVAGGAHGELRGGAKLVEQTLVVSRHWACCRRSRSRRQYVKTLEAQVQLDNLDSGPEA